MSNFIPLVFTNSVMSIILQATFVAPIIGPALSTLEIFQVQKICRIALFNYYLPFNSIFLNGYCETLFIYLTIFQKKYYHRSLKSWPGVLYIFDHTICKIWNMKTSWKVPGLRNFYRRDLMYFILIWLMMRSSWVRWYGTWKLSTWRFVQVSRFKCHKAWLWFWINSWDSWVFFCFW